MKFGRKIVLLMVCMVLPYILAVIALVFYVHAHPGPVPRSISLSMLFFFSLTIVVGGIFLSRSVRTQAKIETSDEGRARRARAVKGLKIGMLVWALILLNDVRLLAQHDIPWRFAIPGTTISVVLMAVFWASLRRLKKAEANVSASGSGPKLQQ